LFHKSVVLLAAGQTRDAIALSEEVIGRFEAEPDPEVLAKMATIF
jgi:hypothetical protein